MIWYQGEANGGDGDVYTVKLNALITGLRKAWNEGDFPVYFVQLPNGGGGNANPDGGDGWAKIRMAQFKALAVKNTGMAVTIDTSETGDIHPFDKLDVGNRLAQLALVKDYGKNLVASGPLYESMKVEGNKIRISFESVGKGLMIGKKNGKEPLQEVAAGKLEQFAIAQSDAAAASGLKWFWADAVIDGATVVVSSLSVTHPVAVHYAYTNNPSGNKLYNKDGLPASPFRTELEHTNKE
jgi:sialate O-acetylesterase